MAERFQPGGDRAEYLIFSLGNWLHERTNSTKKPRAWPGWLKDEINDAFNKSSFIRALPEPRRRLLKAVLDRLRERKRLTSAEAVNAFRIIETLQSDLDESRSR